MKIRLFLFPLLLLSLQTVPLHLNAQDIGEEAAQDSVVIQPYSSTGIIQALSSTKSLLTLSEAYQLTEEQIITFTTDSDTLFAEIHEFLNDSALVSLEGINVRELDNIIQRTTSYKDEVIAIQEKLTMRASEIEESTQHLNTTIHRWDLTIESIPQEEMPRERLARIERNIFMLDSVRAILQKDIGLILKQQDRFEGLSLKLESLQLQAHEMKTELGGSLAAREMPGFFSDLSNLKDPTMVQKHKDALVNSVRSDYKILKSDYLGNLVFALVGFLILLAIAIYYKKNLSYLIASDRFNVSEMQLVFIGVPLATMLFTISVLIRFLIPTLPHAFSSMNLVLMMLPLSILVVRLYGKQFRLWIPGLFLLYTFTMLYEQSYYPDILLRIFLMCFTLAAIGLFMWVAVKKPIAGLPGSPFSGRIIILVTMAFLVLLFVAIIANLVGAFRLAEFLTLLPIQISVLAIEIQVAIKLAHRFIFLFLANKHVQKANVIRDEFDNIYKKTTRLVSVLLWLFFISVSLNIFRVKEVVLDWGRGVLTNGHTLGEVTLSLWSFIIFFFVIWLSIVITRTINRILEKDVFTRVEMAKGVPSTIILLIRIVLITGGFLLAAAAAGMELTNLSIVLGAFSVGIGFGLQNIFNNMVSGLILAFERPIKVGDVVQVGELTGTVRTIGLRSSTVKSFDGAEVIVPNGNLISNQMINWTLSDSNRRMDIRVGVAYGTNPQQVLDIMETIAGEHPQVRKKPGPTAYFIEFADSALSFRMLAWTNLENRLTVESELLVSLDKALKDAGIEIPFPQTDLHIRSDATRDESKK